MLTKLVTQGFVVNMMNELSVLKYKKWTFISKILKLRITFALDQLGAGS